MRSPSRLASALLFLDTSVPDYESLMHGVLASIEVVLLDPFQDGIAQITEELTQRTQVSNLHIVSHGSEACLKLGATELNARNLDAYGWELQQWGDALTSDAEVLLYACNLAAGEAGKNFVRGFGLLIGAKVAASKNLTGNADLGGDWSLGFSTGPIHSRSPFKSEVFTNYTGVLATFTVTNTNDSGAGSLRQAITDANATSGPHTIRFAIGATGSPQTIFLRTALPPIVQQVTINGWSQGGAGYDGVPLIELNGALITPGDGFTTPAGDGLTLGSNLFGASSNGSTIQGLAIRQFPASGIFVQSSNNTIQGNHITGNGRFIQQGGNTLPGGGGITLFPGFTGSPSNNLIGSTDANEPELANLIAFNIGHGVGVLAGTGNRVQGNSIFSNVALGIELGAGGVPPLPDAVTPNDSNDVDSGANGLQNFPVITRVESASNATTIEGRINSLASRAYIIELFASPSLDATGFSEGRVFLGRLETTTNAQGNANFTFVQPTTPVPAGFWITAVAIDKANGNTSEFSEGLRVVETNQRPGFVVGLTPNLGAIAEDLPPQNNLGVRVVDLVRNFVTDPNRDNARGIAVTSLDTRNGTWEFSTNDGATWTPFGAVSETNATVLTGELVLYDAARGGNPESQGAFVFPNIDLQPNLNAATENVGLGGTILNTGSNDDNTIYAGYSTLSANGRRINPNYPDLDRNRGFSLTFNAQILAETRTDENRAGFSVIALSSDGRGIELGFQRFSDNTGRIFAQADGSTPNPGGQPNGLFVAAENVTFNVNSLTDYTLNIQGNTYRLFANGFQILEGPLRDYSAFNFQIDPYETPNFIFLGDNTTSARASVLLRRVALQNENRIRFVPNPGFLGTANIGLRAWDGTDRSLSGSTNVDTTLPESATAFSAVTATAGLTVTGRVPPTVSVSDAFVFEGSGGIVNALFTITLSNPTTVPVSVTYQTLDASATGGQDFVAIAPTTVNFAAGETSKTFSVAVFGDRFFEANETFSLQLFNPTNATLGDGFGIVTIQNDDGRPIRGTARAERLVGTFLGEEIRGLGGDDLLRGGAGDDVLFGNRGSDTLAGGLGNDLLFGGRGNDFFQFGNPFQGVDTIFNFSVAEDTIRVSGLGFGGGLVRGSVITRNQFVVAERALDAGDRFIFNRSTGALFFDVDGIGAAAQIQIAQLTPGLALTRQDIFVF